MDRALRRLGAETLSALPPAVRRPAFDRASLPPSIVHLGLGAFARAHLAAVNDAAGNAPWGIHGVSLRHADVRDALAPQQALYSLTLRNGGGARTQVIG